MNFFIFVIMKNFEELHTSILDNIEFLRKSRGHSLELVGKYLGLSKTGYRKIEKGESQISLKQLHTLSLIYEVSLQKLLFEKLYQEVTLK